MEERTWSFYLYLLLERLLIIRYLCNAVRQINADDIEWKGPHAPSCSAVLIVRQNTVLGFYVFFVCVKEILNAFAAGESVRSGEFSKLIV